jgi:S1-C subfamily serine protease
VERAGTLALIVAAGATGAGVTIGAGGLARSTTTVPQIVTVPDASAASVERPVRSGLTVHDVYERAAPGVVHVATAARGLGSGFVIDKAGHIVTSDRALRGADALEISFSEDERLPASVVGRDPATGVALLQVRARSRALVPLRLGDSGAVQIGDSVLAIANPRGDGRFLAAGIVSGLQRGMLSPAGDTIETDATPRSAGGPLLDMRGRVVGLSIRSGLAIPIDTVKAVVAQLLAGGSPTHAFLGVDARAITPRVAKLFRLPTRSGLLVGTVCAATGAAKAGLRGGTQQVTLGGDTWPVGGDIVVKLDGAPVDSVDAMHTAIAGKRPGDTVHLEIYRGNSTKTLEVKLGRQPASPRC